MVNDILTIEEVAKILRVSRQTIYKLCKEGTLPYFKLGRTMRFKKADIEAICSTASATTN